MPEKRILVTGGAGFIGSHLVDRLLSRGHRVAIVDNLSAGHLENVPREALFYQMDIRNPRLAEVFQQEKFQVVFHLAAQPSVPESVINPVKDAEINIIGSLNLIEIARRYELEKFIFASSGGAVYGEPLCLPCDEEHPARPLSPYGTSKHAVECYLHMYGKNYKTDYTILRYSNVYGPRQQPLGETGVVPIFAEAMMNGTKLVINGDGEQERDFVYVEDVVEATILAMNEGTGQVYNIGSGLGTSVNLIFSLLKDILNYLGSAVHAPAKPGEVSRIHLDISNAQKGLGWYPQVPLQAGLTMTMDYLRRSKRRQ